MSLALGKKRFLHMYLRSLWILDTLSFILCTYTAARKKICSKLTSFSIVRDYAQCHYRILWLYVVSFSAPKTALITRTAQNDTHSFLEPLKWQFFKKTVFFVKTYGPQDQQGTNRCFGLAWQKQWIRLQYMSNTRNNLRIRISRLNRLYNLN